MEKHKRSFKLRILFIVAILITLFASFGINPALAADAGYALQFDGENDYVELWETASMLAPGWENTKTVSLWLKPTGTAAVCLDVGNCDLVFGDRPRWWGISRANVNGNDRLWVWNQDGQYDAIGITYVPDEWIHIALVHGGGRLRAYKNGIQVGDVASGATRQPRTGAHPILQIGGMVKNPTSKWVFEGQIDEVQIWNTIRTAEEISLGMFQTLVGNEPGLAAYYPMSDGAGIILTDDSVNAWDGTLYDYLKGLTPQWVVSGAFDGAPTNPPVADPQSVITDEETAVSITLTGSDPDGDPISFIIVSQPTHGILSGTAPVLTYLPESDYFGVDSFTFKVNDGIVYSSIATVDLTINPINDLPVALDDAAATSEATPVLIDVLGNDNDVDGDLLTISAAGNPVNGSVLNNGNNLTYTPNPGFTGTDTFSYTIDDGYGGTAAAQVSVLVTPHNDPPLASDDTALTDEDFSVLVDVLSNDADPDGDALTIISVGTTPNGSITNNGSNLTYSPNANFNGIDSFSYTISDGNGATASALVTITVNPINDLPAALDDAAVTGVDTPVLIDVLGNDSDVDGDLLTISAVGNPVNGSVLNNGNNLTYTPNPGFTGADTFSYTIDDGYGGTAAAQVNVTVNPINNAGYALDFDGTSNYVKLGDTGNIMGGNGWASSKTISFWVKPTGLTGPSTPPVSGEFIIGNDLPHYFGVTRAVWNGADRLWVWNYDGNTDYIGIAFTPGEWIHIALVHTGGTLFAYKNGVLIGSVSSGPTVIPNGTVDGNLYLAGSDNTRTLHFKGQLDEVSLWNVGLNQATIQGWLDKELTDAHPNWSNLAAYYQMNTGAGLVLSDDSPHTNDGTLLGGMTDSNWVNSGIWQ